MKVLMIKRNLHSKVESLNIQIFENDENTNDDDDNDNDNENNQVVVEKEDDTGRTDDPVRMYLKEMGNVELLSRGEIEIAKRIESGKNKTTDAFSKSFISMESIFNFYQDYINGEKQLRDFIDLDANLRSVNGEPDDFQDISIKDDEIFTDQEENPNTEKDNEEDEIEYESDSSEDVNEASDLSILEKRGKPQTSHNTKT